MQLEIMAVVTVEVERESLEKVCMTFLLNGCAVEIVNPATVSHSDLVTVRVTATPQQVYSAQGQLRAM